MDLKFTEQANPVPLFNMCQKTLLHFGYFRNDLPRPITLFPLYPLPNSLSFPSPISLAVN